VNDELGTVWKESIAAYFILFQYFPGGNGKNHVKCVRISSLQAKVWIQGISRTWSRIPNHSAAWIAKYFVVYERGNYLLHFENTKRYVERYEWHNNNNRNERQKSEKRCFKTRCYWVYRIGQTCHIIRSWENKTNDNYKKITSLIWQCRINVSFNKNLHEQVKQFLYQIKIHSEEIWSITQREDQQRSTMAWISCLQLETTFSWPHFTQD